MKTLSSAVAVRLTRGCFLFCFLVIALSAFKCGRGGQQQPTANLPAGLAPSDVQAAGLVLRQRTETEDMVSRFKKKDFSSSQIEFAKIRYDRSMAKANAALDRIRQDITSSPGSEQEAEFRGLAQAAVDDCVVLDSLLETALNPGISALNLSNFVLRNANTLPDAWVAVWKASRKLQAADRQQFLVYLDRELKWKRWEAVNE